MQPGTQYKLLVAQSASNTNTAISPGKTDLFTPDHLIMLTIICLPIFLFGGILGRNAYQQRHARLLKQQIMKLERAWKAEYKEKQDR